MALLIPFAAPLQALARVRSDQVRGGGADDVLPPLPPLPNLAALIAQSTPVERDDGDEWSLTPPHERALARALGWSGSDGQLPFAARAARADGLDSGDVAVGLVTPSHWHLGTDQVSLVDPAALVLAKDESHALFDAVLPTFTSEGFGFAYGAADRWYLLHESLAELATASLDRVIGRNVDRWLGSQPAARRLRRLQSEVQMLLYEHPVNAAREARGLLPVNSFWLSGCGVAQPERRAGPDVDLRLRAAALAGDAAGWVRAWETLDAGPLAVLLAAAQRGEPVELVLCGERSSVVLASRPRRWWQRIAARWAAPPSPLPLLEAL